MQSHSCSSTKKPVPEGRMLIFQRKSSASASLKKLVETSTGRGLAFLPTNVGKTSASEAMERGSQKKGKGRTGGKQSVRIGPVMDPFKPAARGK